MFIRGAALLLLFALLQLVLCAEDYYNVRQPNPDPCTTLTNILKLLGISRQASDKEIKSAYRRLSKKYHPDKNP